MALWLVRMGKHGEYEERFVSTKRIYATWHGLAHDLSQFSTRQDLRKLVRSVYTDWTDGHVMHSAGQLWTFSHDMNIGDWVVLPFKNKPAINIAQITGAYQFDGRAEEPFYHSREIKWVERDLPRSRFDQDLLYSFGAFMTIREISRNEAEKRVRAMVRGEPGPQPGPGPGPGPEPKPVEEVDLEQLAKDQIAKLLIRKFQGHGLARVVDAILRAQGYTTFLSPAGPDRGIDILAAPGPLGFGNPRLCVQVKSGDSPVDSPTLNQLIGSMQNVHADQGLLVAWGGFKSSVDREVPSQFFRVRLWDQDAIIQQLLANYDRLDEDLRAELPLKRIWTVASQEDEAE